MLNRIFPREFDNNYRGHKVALWLFVPIVFIKVGISLSSIFDGYNTVRSADGIPLDTFTSGGAEAVVSGTALLGLSHFLLASLCVLALIRYRAMIPLMYAPLLVEFLAKKWILLVKPIVRTGTSPQHLRKPGAHRSADRWPGAIATEQGQSSAKGMIQFWSL